MGRKGAKAKAAPTAAAAAPAAVAGGESPSNSKDSWLDALPEADRKLANSTDCKCLADLEIQKKKLQERTEKAEKAQRQQLHANEQKKQWEKQQEKNQRGKEREDRKWQVELEKIKQRALQEGVVQAYDYGDGKWWIELEGKIWKEVQGEYFCILCEKHLHDSTLGAHIDSEAHKKKVAWNMAPSAAASAAPGSGSYPNATTQPPASAPTWCPPVSSSMPVEDWQELGADGLLRCIPCGKVIDGCHLATDDHANRLTRWRAQKELEKSGYAAPALPYLAWVPDPSGGGERYMKCLLCGKWAQDDTSHSGTQQAPGGSKEHRKNLVNYGPGNPWYEENVVRERLKYHPNAPAPTVSATMTNQGRGSSVATPAPWASQPASRTVPQPPTSTPPPPLPPGWEKGPAPNAPGKFYYFNRKTGESSWTPPSLRVSTEAAAATAATPATPTTAPSTPEVEEDDEIVEC